MFYSQEQYDEYQADLHGDGFSNEYQRAFFVSQLGVTRINERAQAEALAAAGKFVVCAEHEVCCPVTDGLIGYDFVIVKACDTLHQAEILTQSSDYVFLFQLEPPEAPAPQVQPDNDEIPF